MITRSLSPGSALILSRSAFKDFTSSTVPSSDPAGVVLLDLRGKGEVLGEVGQRHQMKKERTTDVQLTAWSVHPSGCKVGMACGKVCNAITCFSMLSTPRTATIHIPNGNTRFVWCRNWTADSALLEFLWPIAWELQRVQQEVPTSKLEDAVFQMSKVGVCRSLMGGLLISLSGFQHGITQPVSQATDMVLNVWHNISSCIFLSVLITCTYLVGVLLVNARHWFFVSDHYNKLVKKSVAEQIITDKGTQGKWSRSWFKWKHVDSLDMFFSFHREPFPRTMYAQGLQQHSMEVSTKQPSGFSWYWPTWAAGIIGDHQTSKTAVTIDTILNQKR